MDETVIKVKLVKAIQFLTIRKTIANLIKFETILTIPPVLKQYVKMVAE